MFIIDVIPLSRGMRKETLSYFSLQEMSRGTVVSVPVRRKNIGAIVVNVRDAKTVKADVKRAHYGLKKIVGKHAESAFLPAFIDASQRAARYFAGSTGAIIETLVPSVVLRAITRGMTLSSARSVPAKQRKDVLGAQKYAFQAPEKERLAAYKGIIREEFAKRHSVFFCIPTIDEIAYAVFELSRGIEQRTYILHGDLSNKQFLETWNSAVSNPYPVLIVGTGSILSVPRHDINTIIIDNEYNWAYKREHRPFIDIRTFAEHYADALGGQLIMGGAVLRVETLYNSEMHEFSHLAPPTMRPLSPAEPLFVDMRKTHTPLQLTAKTFSIISDELKTAILKAQNDNQNVFLFVSRRGLFPITLCGDCGSVILCQECAAPLVLHRKTEHQKEARDKREKRLFLCHKCRKSNAVKDRCETCNSWRLTSLGVGIAHVEEKLRKLLPGISILRIDKDSASTTKRAEKLMRQFLDTPGGILVGTEMALNLLHKKIAVTAAVSVDSLLALPSFRMYERVFILLMRLREKAVKKFIMQTRMPDAEIFEYVRTGNVTDFYTYEKKIRADLGYPPFITLIKLTSEGTRARIEQEMATIKKVLREYAVFVFPAFTSKVRGKYIVHAVIKIKRGEWPNEKLSRLLREIPQSVAINVDPEHLL